MEAQGLSWVRIRLDNPHRMRNLLQSWNIIESVATFTLDVSVFGPLWLSVRNESFLGKFVSEHRSRHSIEVKSSPHPNLCIFMSDFWRRSTITSGSRVSSDCQHQENNAATIQESTHSVMANSVNHQQVIIMNEYSIAIRCLLHN
jgi:hypothetical protein